MKCKIQARMESSDVGRETSRWASPKWAGELVVREPNGRGERVVDECYGSRGNTQHLLPVREYLLVHDMIHVRLPIQNIQQVLCGRHCHAIEGFHGYAGHMRCRDHVVQSE